MISIMKQIKTLDIPNPSPSELGYGGNFKAKDFT